MKQEKFSPDKSTAMQVCKGFMVLLYLVLASCSDGSSQSTVQPVDVWEDVRSALDSSDIANLTLVVGTVDGNVFVHQKGNSTADTVYELASGSKWMAAAAIMQLVEEGVLSLDDNPQDYIEWWDKDDNDQPINGPRSRITLEQLLSFTSGFNANAILVSCVSDPDIFLEDCAKDIHDNFFMPDVEPGEVFYYGPSHLQVAGFMVEKATGKSWQQIFAQNIVTPLSLSNTSYVSASDSNPRVAGGVASTANEYARFLRALLSGEMLQQSFPYMRTDRTKDVFSMDTFVIEQLGFEWHYGFGEWRECDQPVWSDTCEQNVILSSPGAYGWYPWVDMERGYFAILAMQLPVSFDNPPPERSITLAQSIRSKFEADIPVTVTAGQMSKLSTDGFSYANPEILSSENKMTFQDKSGVVWLANLDPVTGNFISAGGRETLLDSGAASLAITFNGSEFGVDSDGWSVFYSKQVDSTVQVWRAFFQDGTAAPITTGESHMAALPNRNANASSTRLIHIRGDWNTGTLAWIDEASPELESDFSEVDSIDTTHPNWIYNTNSIVFSHRGLDLGQLALLDTDTGVVTTLTSDPGDKIFPFGWQAPDFDNETLVLALVDRTAIAVYRDTGETFWERIATLEIPAISPGIYVNSAQAFVAGGKSYISLNIKKNDERIPGDGDSEIWIFDLDEAQGSRFALRCDDGNSLPTMRIDPKAYLGLDQVYVYYNVFSADLNFEVYKCATGISTN